MCRVLAEARVQYETSLRLIQCTHDSETTIEESTVFDIMKCMTVDYPMELKLEGIIDIRKLAAQFVLSPSYKVGSFHHRSQMLTIMCIDVTYAVEAVCDDDN